MVSLPKMKVEENSAGGKLEKTVDSKYVQQHLANERTFLAWIRTSIAIVGLGFLISQVVFHTSSNYNFIHIIAAIIGFTAFILGVIVTLCATRDYVLKRRGINNETFCSPIFSIIFLSTILSIILAIIILILTMADLKI